MTLLPYYSPSTLIEARGNNAFSWNERKAYYQKKPTLYVPSLIVGSLEDVQIGTEIVFEEMQDGVMYSCV